MHWATEVTVAVGVAGVATGIGGVVSLGRGALYLGNCLYKDCEPRSCLHQQGRRWTGVQSLQLVFRQVLGMRKGNSVEIWLALNRL